MVRFSVSTPTLGYSASSLNTAVGLFDAQIAQATAAVNAVVGASWTGSASDEFAQAWTAWLATAELTRAALLDVATLLQGAQVTYEVTESGLARMFEDSTPRGGGKRGASTGQAGMTLETPARERHA